MIKFEINQQSGPKISNHYWSKWSGQLTSILKLKKDLEISVGIVGETRMRVLNKHYRRQNKVTDVLSFGERDVAGDFRDFDGYLGEIIICYPQALRQAHKASRPVIKEIEWLLVHGCLHLLGYDHQTDRQEAAMRELEQKITKVG
ncbi:MAG: rRNA maturation RNase YbeY [Patescibacteria group bacterium]|jgi:probable rRNA maturation factor|nr:rRNA maturation RNase YbeY [Patescibacteria group bacterium]